MPNPNYPRRCAVCSSTEVKYVYEIRGIRSLDARSIGGTMLYKAIELPSDEPIRFAGVYVLEWGKLSQPTVGFIEVEEEVLNHQQDTIDDLVSLLRKIMVMFPDMCADANMLDSPFTLSLINQAQDALIKHGA